MKLTFAYSRSYYFTEFIETTGSLDATLYNAAYLCDLPLEWKRLIFAGKIIFDDFDIDSKRVEFSNLRKNLSLWDTLGINIVQKDILGDVTSNSFLKVNEIEDLIQYKLRDYKYPSWGPKKYLSTYNKDGKLLKEEKIDRPSIDGEIKSAKRFLEIMTPKTKSTNEVFLSVDPVLNRLYTDNILSFNSSNILSLLATCGLSVVLPNIYSTEDDVIDEIKDTFAEERLSFLDNLRSYIKECHEGLQSGYYKDVLHYSDIVLNQDLIVQKNKFEKAVKSSRKKLLNRLKIGVLDGTPRIGEAWLDPKKSVIQQSIVEFLKIVSKNFESKSTIKEARAKFPLASYSYDLSKTLNKDH